MNYSTQRRRDAEKVREYFTIKFSEFLRVLRVSAVNIHIGVC